MINESVETINARLIDYFGIAWNGLPIWRVVWSEDQFEKRITAYDDKGAQLLIPEIRELPKYRQWIHNKYVLERLTVVPDINKDTLIDKITYEPIFVFETGKGEALPAKWEAAKFVIDTLLAAQGTESMWPKYVDEEMKNPQETRNARITQLQEDLFGNEIGPLEHGGGIVVPNNYEKKDN